LHLALAVPPPLVPFGITAAEIILPLPPGSLFMASPFFTVPAPPVRVVGVVVLVSIAPITILIVATVGLSLPATSLTLVALRLQPTALFFQLRLLQPALFLDTATLILVLTSLLFPLAPLLLAILFIQTPLLFSLSALAL